VTRAAPGALVASHAVADTQQRAAGHAMMVGGRRAQTRPFEQREPRDARRRTHGGARAAGDGRSRPAGGAGLSVSVRAGEIVGVAGVSGNGQRELVEALAGQRPSKRAAMRWHGERLSRHAAREPAA
jgi:simple sugar transport system ATP-binding protein